MLCHLHCLPSCKHATRYFSTRLKRTPRPLCAQSFETITSTRNEFGEHSDLQSTFARLKGLLPLRSSKYETCIDDRGCLANSEALHKATHKLKVSAREGPTAPDGPGTHKRADCALRSACSPSDTVRLRSSRSGQLNQARCSLIRPGCLHINTFSCLVQSLPSNLLYAVLAADCDKLGVGASSSYIVRVSEQVMSKIYGLQTISGEQQPASAGKHLLSELLSVPPAANVCCMGLLISNIKASLWALCSAEQAVAAEVSLPNSVDLARCFNGTALHRLLVLDGLQDPGNLVQSDKLIPRVYCMSLH